MELATLAALAIRVLVVVAMAAIGMRLGRSETATVVLDPLVFARLAVVNLIAVPLLGLAACLVVPLEPPVALALLVLAAAPAASIAPKLIEIARGDLAVGVLATFTFAAATTVTLPPTLEILTTAADLPGVLAVVDGWTIVANLAAFQLAPLVASLLVVRHRPALAGRAVRPLTHASNVLLVVVIALVTLDAGDDLLRIGPSPILVTASFAAACLVLGWLAGGGTTPVQRAAALVTAGRSASVALLVALGIGDPMTSAAVVAFSLVLLAMNASVAFSLGHRPERLAIGAEA